MVDNMRNSNVSEKIKFRKIDKYFYRSPERETLKYSHYCIEKIAKQNLFIIIKI